MDNIHLLPDMLAQTLTQVQTFFSMTFFNWTGDDNGQPGTSKPTVSGYLWIYVVVSAVFTLLTVGAWWCFSICRLGMAATRNQIKRTEIGA